MPVVPQNNTDTYFVDYSTEGTPHTFQVRAVNGTAPATVGTAITAFLTAVSPLLYPLSITGTRFRQNLSTVSNPIDLGMDGDLYGSGTPTGDDIPRELDFVGRSFAGKRVRLGIYGTKAGISLYRITSAESANVADAVAVLNGSAGVFIAVDGVQPIWYPYANYLFNAYWQRKIRG